MGCNIFSESNDRQLSVVINIFIIFRQQYDAKIYVADFGHYEGSTSVMNFGENPQHDFPKMRGGVNGRLELFRKLIRFGRAKLP